MSRPKYIRLIAILLTQVGLAACAGSDPADLIPVGLRATIAAEDRAKQQGADKPVSVNDMLARARGDKAPGAPAPAARAAASAQDDQPLPSGRNAPSQISSGPLPERMASTALPPADGPAAPLPRAPAAAPAAPNGVHPLWAQMNAGRGLAAAPTATVPRAAATDRPPSAPEAGATNIGLVVLRFPGGTSELDSQERARLDAAVTLHKSSGPAARIVAGPSSDSAPFERLLKAERRSQAIEQALPPGMKRTSVYSPDIDNDTVRVEFQASRP
jgi:hypothetical protein